MGWVSRGVMAAKEWKARECIDNHPPSYIATPPVTLKKAYKKTEREGSRGEKKKETDAFGDNDDDGGDELRGMMASGAWILGWRAAGRKREGADIGQVTRSPWLRALLLPPRDRPSPVQPPPRAALQPCCRCPDPIRGRRRRWHVLPAAASTDDYRFLIYVIPVSSPVPLLADGLLPSVHS